MCFGYAMAWGNMIRNQGVWVVTIISFLSAFSRVLCTEWLFSLHVFAFFSASHFHVHVQLMKRKNATCSHASLKYTVLICAPTLSLYSMAGRGCIRDATRHPVWHHLPWEGTAQDKTEKKVRAGEEQNCSCAYIHTDHNYLHMYT